MKRARITTLILCNLSSIIKIGFRPLRNNELLIILLKMYRDTLRKGYELNRCLSAENLIALHKNQFSIVVSSWFSPLNLQVNSLTNRFLSQSEFRFYYRTQVCNKNKQDVDEIKQDYLKGLTIHYVSKMNEVLNLALLKEKVKTAIQL